MAAIDFPNSPTVGQLFGAQNSVTYQWNGTLWQAVGGIMTPSPGGDFFAIGPCGTGNTSTPTVVIPPNVLSGNATGVYSTSTGRYTPPAGRFFIYAWVFASSPSASLPIVYLYLYKNGALLHTNSFAGQMINATANGPGAVDFQFTVDANGTDYFELRCQTTVVAANLAGVGFGAFPISGIKGPPGDPGQLGFRLLQRTAIGSAVPDVSIQNIPADINDLRIGFDLSPVSNDQNLCLQFYDGGVLDATAAHYSWANVINWNSNASTSAISATGTATSGVTNCIVVSYGFLPNGGVSNAALGSIAGEINLTNIRSARPKHATYQADHLNGSGTYIAAVSGGGWRNVGAAITGLRLVFGSGNIASGAFSVWGSP